MARSRTRRRKLPAEPGLTTIEDLAHDGRGVGRVEGKTVFIDGALPGERVRFRYVAAHRRYDEGQALEIQSPSPVRTEPRCPHFDVCGGCSLQHVEADHQIVIKERVLLENLQRIGEVEPHDVLEPITGPHWGYRRKARLGAKYVAKKNRALVGFREKHSSFLAEMHRCEVLHPAVGLRISALADLIEELDACRRIPQIEVAVTDTAAALVFRNLDPLSEPDRERLRKFAVVNEFQIYLQPAGPDSVAPLWPEQPRLFYHLEDFDIELEFAPTDFAQVNFDINRKMILRALGILAPGPTDHVLDLFCGIGNFSLPLARSAGQVTGVEGEARLVRRAEANAERNGISNARFLVDDLAHPVSNEWQQKRFDKVLLDPPRSGARGVLETVAGCGAELVVYISCHPGSLARDAGELVHRHGFRLEKAGVMDMFPHTAHVESIAVFRRG